MDTYITCIQTFIQTYVHTYTRTRTRTRMYARTILRTCVRSPRLTDATDGRLKMKQKKKGPQYM